MALDASRLEGAIQPALATEIVSQMDTKWPLDGLDASIKSTAQQQRDDFAEVLSKSIAKIVAEKVIDEFINNAEVATALVSSALSVANVSGVTVGAGTSGPGSGTVDNVNATGGIS